MQTFQLANKKIMQVRARFLKITCLPLMLELTITEYSSWSCRLLRLYCASGIIYKILSFVPQQTFKVDIILHFTDDGTGSKGLSPLPSTEAGVSRDLGLLGGTGMAGYSECRPASCPTLGSEEVSSGSSEWSDRWFMRGNLLIGLTESPSEYFSVPIFLHLHTVLRSLVVRFPGALSIRNCTLEGERGYSRKAP